MNENVELGGVTWHSSEEEGGPDVGISVVTGKNERLYCGEISRTLFDDNNGGAHFDSDGGWFLVRFAEDTTLIAKFTEPHVAQEFMDNLAAWVRSSGEHSNARD